MTAPAAVQSKFFRPLTAQQETFVEQLVKTGNATQAYFDAGFTASSRHIANVCAGKLLKHPRIQRRIAMIRGEGAVRAEKTIASLVGDLDEARALAVSIKNPTAAVAATMAQAKLLGMIVERTEHGKPGDFEALDTVDAVLRAVSARVGAEAAAAIGKLVGAPVIDLEAEHIEPESVPPAVETQDDTNT